MADRDWPALWRKWQNEWEGMPQGRGKAAGFTFFVKDWMTDADVRSMSAFARGVYIDLLAVNWWSASLPQKCVLQLAKVIGIDARSFRKVWPTLAPHFVEVAPGRISNKRLILEAVALIGTRERKRRQRSSGLRDIPVTKLGHPRVLTRDGDGDGSSSSSSGGEKTQEPETDIRDGSGGLGGNPENDRLKLRLEGRYDPEIGRLVDEVAKFARSSPRTAEELFLRLREPKIETFRAWEHYAQAHSRAATLGAMHNWSHPDEVPEELKTDPRGNEIKARARAVAARRKTTTNGGTPCPGPTTLEPR